MQSIKAGNGELMRHFSVTVVVPIKNILKTIVLLCSVQGKSQKYVFNKPWSGFSKLIMFINAWNS